MNSALRGALFFGAWLIGPLAIGLTAAAVGLSLIAFMLMLVWYGIVFPHANVSTGCCAPNARDVWSFPVAATIALAQWIAVAATYGYGVRNLSRRAQIGLAPIVIALVGVAVYALIIGAGYFVNSGP